MYVTALLARELGSGRFPQTLAALCAGFAPLILAGGHLAGPTVYDLFGWVIVSLLIMRILRTGNERLWLAVGVVTASRCSTKRQSCCSSAACSSDFS